MTGSGDGEVGSAGGFAGSRVASIDLEAADPTCYGRRGSVRMDGLDGPMDRLSGPIHGLFPFFVFPNL